MRRPQFNKFSNDFPHQDYNDRMREYLVYLEHRVERLSQEKWRLEYRVEHFRESAQKTYSAERETQELRTTLKILRNQIRKAFAEG